MPIRALSTAATGMIGQQQNIDVIADNLANVNTTGYKRSRANFQDLFYQKLQPAGVTTSNGNQRPTPIEIGLGTRMVSTAKEHTQGAFEITENQFDWAMDGDGFFRITYLDGTERYTRDGSFKVDKDGRIVTNDGFPLADNITVPPETVSLNVGQTGLVQAVLGDGTTQDLGQIQIAKFINPSGLRSEGQNLFAITPASGDPITANPGAIGFGTLRQGVLENSNVQVVTELVNMIKAQRSFEINSNSIKVADQMLQVVNNLRT